MNLSLLSHDLFHIRAKISISYILLERDPLLLGQIYFHEIQLQSAYKSIKKAKLLHSVIRKRLYWKYNLKLYILFFCCSKLFLQVVLLIYAYLKILHYTMTYYLKFLASSTSFGNRRRASRTTGLS